MEHYKERLARRCHGLASSRGAAAARAGRRPLSSPHAGCHAAPISTSRSTSGGAGARQCMLDIGQDGCPWRRATITASAVVTAEATQSISASPFAAFVTALTLGGARLPVTGVGRSSGSLHDNSVVHAPLEGGTWPCMTHGAPAEPHANESWTAMHCQAGTVPVSASRLCRLDWPQGHYCDPEEGPFLYAPCQTCLSETAVWGSLAGGSGSLLAGSRRFSRTLKWAGVSAGDL